MTGCSGTTGGVMVSLLPDLCDLRTPSEVSLGRGRLWDQKLLSPHCIVRAKIPTLKGAQ